MEIFSGNPRKVICSRDDVARFRAHWPCAELRNRAYWFEFDAGGDLIDCDVPESDDGSAAKSLADDCQQFLETGELPDWLKGK